MNNIFGKKMGRYTLLEQLGTGGMATVYNAYDNRMERNVALKVILPSKRHSDLFLNRFNLEARALAQLSHTNVVKVLDYGEEEGLPYLVMEFVPGGTLSDRMESPLPWQEAAALLIPIARALQYVHNQKIIHRDIKPSNILLDENGHPKISDFGIVKLVENEDEAKTSTGVGVGTPDYMSPEQCMGKNIDERADIYALGVVLFEMITGQKPFSAESPMGIVIKHVTGTFPRPRKIRKDLPKSVEAVVLKATARDRDCRYQKMADFADELEKIAKGSKTSLKNTKKTAGMRKRRSLLAAGLSLLAVAALGTVAWFVNPSNLQVTLKSYLGLTTPQPVVILQQIYITSTPWIVTATPASATVQPTGISTNRAAPAPTATQTPQPSAAPQVLMANQPLPDLKTNQRLENFHEIARWGVGNFNVSAWSDDNQTIALAGTAGIYLYDSTSFNLSRFIDTPDWINTMIFSRDGSEVITGSMQKKIHAWDIKSGALKRVFEYSEPENSAFIDIDKSPQVSCLEMSQDSNLLAAGFSNGVINIWDYETQKLTFHNIQLGEMTDISFSADRRFVTTSGSKGFNVWDLSNGKIYLTIPTTTRINAFVFSPDSNFIVSGGADWIVRYWEASGRLLKTFNAGAGVNTISLSKDGTILAAGLENGQIILWDVEAWQNIAGVDGHPDEVRSVSFSPSGERLLSTSWDEDLMIWSVPNLENEFTLNENIQDISRLEFSNDEKWLAAGSIDKTVRLWNIKEGSIAHIFEGHLPKGINFSPDSLYLVTASSPDVTWEEGQLNVWNLQTGELAVSLSGYQPDHEVYFSPDGKLLISGNVYNAIIWDVSTFFRLRIQGGHNAGCGVYYSPQNEVLAVFSPGGILYDYNNNVKEICALREKTFVAVKHIPNANSQNVFVKQVSNGRETGVIFSWNHNSPPKSAPLDDDQLFLGTSPDKKILFIVSPLTNTLQLRGSNLGGSNLGLSFPYFREYQYVIASSNQGRYLAIGGNDGVIHIWGRR